MAVVSAQEAIGMVLQHAITEIMPGRFNGPAFKRDRIKIL